MTRAFVLLLLVPTVVPPARADVVLDWNRIAQDTLVANTDLQNPGMASRSMAMLNLAIYDAFAMTKPGATMFYDYGAGNDSPAMSVSTEAAAAQAAYTVLSSIYADQQTALSASLATSLAGVVDDQAKTDGIELGAMIGESIVSRRAGDGYDSMSQYMPTNAPGRWQPDPLNPDQEAWGPAWGDVQTFCLPSNRSFMPEPPPALDSAEYAAAFDEVKELGAVDSATRTDYQTETGLFWAYDRVGMGTPMRLFNDILQTVSEQEGNTADENAKLFAKATVAMADAGIVAWNSKFEYDLWRPVTGIREADTDGNDLTEADPDWTPLGAPGGSGTDFTPPFPTYVSGHATFGGALFGVLMEHYQTDSIVFDVESDEVPGQTRTYDSFSEAMAENGRSRVYLGIHWNYDDTVGQETGMAIASDFFSRAFVAAVPEPNAGLLAVIGLLFGARVRRR